MKKFIAVPILAVAVIVSVTGCTKSYTSVTPSQSAKASAAASAAKQEGKQLAATKAVSHCLPAKDQTLGDIITIAASRTKRDSLAKCLDIPESNVKPFAVALGQSALSAEDVGGLKTRTGRKEWVNTLPPLVAKYQRQ